MSKSPERIVSLLELYGDLLTRKQQEYTRLHYGEKLPFSKIASRTGVSRQSIYDTVRQALAALNKYEHALQLLPKGDVQQREQPSSGNVHREDSNLSQVKKSLLDIHRRIRHERVIYNTDWILRELRSIISYIEE